jgi:3-methyladenine DNA glycosylase AlkD
LTKSDRGARGSDREQRLVARLNELGAADHAVQEKRYHKSSWEHWGVRAPDMDRAIRECLAGAGEDEIYALCERLWAEPVWDLKIAAARTIAKLVKPETRAWRFVLERMPELDGWAIADTFADIGGRCLIADPERLDTVETWVESGHLWTRRGSLVFTLPWMKPGRDPARMLEWSSRLIADREWFIQKAIGWQLRVLSKHSPERVQAFLSQHGGAVKGVARREATKYLGKQL